MAAIADPNSIIYTNYKGILIKSVAHCIINPSIGAKPILESWVPKQRTISGKDIPASSVTKMENVIDYIEAFIVDLRTKSPYDIHDGIGGMVIVLTDGFVEDPAEVNEWLHKETTLQVKGK